MKPTSGGRWAHVMCALWVPETIFDDAENTMRAITALDTIDKARYRLKCGVCKLRSAGACIQCPLPTCTNAFHVSCGQHAQLLQYSNVRTRAAVARCHIHRVTPFIVFGHACSLLAA